MGPEDYVLGLVVIVFMIGFYCYFGYEIAIDTVPDSIRGTLAWIIGTHLIGLTYLGAAILDSGWIHAVCMLIAIIYGICTIFYGVLFLPAFILAGWFKMIYLVYLILTPKSKTE